MKKYGLMALFVVGKIIAMEDIAGEDCQNHRIRERRLIQSCAATEQKN